MFISNISKYSHYKLWIEQSSGPLKFFSPFVTVGGIALLSNDKFRGSTLVVRGLSNDFASGALSIEALQVLIKNGWTIKVNNKLHAKVYINSNNKCIVGSANLTQSGLSSYPVGNFETFAMFDVIPSELRDDLIVLENDSVTIDLNYLELVNTWLSELGPVLKEIPLFPNIPLVRNSKSEIFTLLDIPQSASLLSIYQNACLNMFDSEILLHDIKLLNLGENFSFEDVKESFKSLLLVKTLISFVGQGERFGVLRRWLELNVTDVPTPSRLEFNLQLNKLYDLIVEAYDGEYYRSKPRHTEFLLKRS